MHMADALISPAVGATAWAATAATTLYCAKRVRDEADQARVPLMGVAGAFVFAGQMLNFSIPGTGSSGHLGGALLLTVLLGPHAAFLVIASVLAVQALFFADGGLLALGANIFNLGVFPAFVAYPLVYRPIAGDGSSRVRVVLGALVAAVVGLQLGAVGVLLQTVLSGVTELPFAAFAALLLPIHVAIGVVEGLTTAAVILFVQTVQPELLTRRSKRGGHGANLKPVLLGLGAVALVFAGFVSWFSSTNPDGLEWSIAGVAGSTEIEGLSTEAHEGAAGLQALTAFMPDYALKTKGESGRAEKDAPEWPTPDASTSTAGLLGGLIVLAVAGAAGWALSRRGRRSGTGA